MVKEHASATSSNSADVYHSHRIVQSTTLLCDEEKKPLQPGASISLESARIAVHAIGLWPGLGYRASPWLAVHWLDVCF